MPYAFSDDHREELSSEEKLMVEKKVFVERRYQTSRKMRGDNQRGDDVEEIVVKPEVWCFGYDHGGGGMDIGKMERESDEGSRDCDISI